MCGWPEGNSIPGTVLPASDEPQIFDDGSEDEYEDESVEDSEEVLPGEEDDEPEDDEPIDSEDDSEEEPVEEEPEVDPIVLEARAKLDDAIESGRPITDPEIIRKLFGRCRA